MAEEVADEPLGALIQVLEVGGKLSVGIPAEIRRWLDADLKCGIGREKETSYPRCGQSGGGASEEPSPTCLLLAICSEEGEEARVFGDLKKKKAKKLWPMGKLQCRWGDL